MTTLKQYGKVNDIDDNYDCADGIPEGNYALNGPYGAFYGKSIKNDHWIYR